MVKVPAKTSFIMGSDQDEREYAYRLDEKVYEGICERKSGQYYESWGDSKELLSFQITRHLITNAKLCEVRCCDGARAGCRPPNLDGKRTIPLSSDPATSLARRQSAGGPRDAPRCSTSHAVAAAYVRWLSKESGVTFRLPREAELEKGLRGIEMFGCPWG